MIKKIRTNRCVIEVEPVKKRFGKERSPDQEYAECSDIVNEIKKHIDDVGYCYIRQDIDYETSYGSTHESLYDAIEEEYGDDFYLRCFRYSYKRPTDNGISSSGILYDFKELAIVAYNNPWEFVETTGCLTEEEFAFISNIVSKRTEELSRKDV